jgi:predicted ribosome quality control (RQC) complex YloA/Tae2 family protein
MPATPDPAESLRQKLTSALAKWRDKARGKIFKLKLAAEDTSKADELRLFGEVLKAHLSEVPRGADGVTLPNMFGGPDLVIPLDRAKSPAENMRDCFRRYQKAARGRESVARLLAAEEKSLSRMSGLEAAIAAAPDLPSLQAIEARLQSLNLFPRPVRLREKVAPAEKKGPRHFVSADGFDILVGRNAQENAELSFRLARGNDWWLHAQDRAGSHVVVRMPSGKDLTQETLLDAATLAAHFSKLRGRPVATVTYTQAKWVSRAKGAPVGTALVQRGREIRLDVDARRLERLLEPAKRLGEE